MFVCGFTYAGPQYTLITPFPPGTINMLTLQAIPELNRVTDSVFKQEVIPGAGGLIATNTFLNNKDPNRLLVATQNVLTLGPMFNPDIKYTKADFRPVALISENYMCLVASDKLKVNNFNDLVNLAKTQQMFYGTNLGVNGMEHVFFQYMAKKYDMKLEAVHYKGATESQLAVAKGDISLGLLPAVMCKNGATNMSVIGYTTTREKQSLPHDLHISAYIAIYAPKETTNEHLKFLSEAFVSVWNENREVLGKLVILPKTVLTGKDLENYIDGQDEKWRKYYKTIQN